MKKSFLLLSAFAFLLSCKSGKTEYSDVEVLPAEEAYYDEYADSLGDYYPEDYEGYDEMYDSPNVRGIYNASRTLFTDLVHTKIEVSFDWEKSQLIGKETLTAKQHFYASDSLILDAKGMDIKKVEMNGKALSFNYKDSLKLRIQLDKTYKRDEKFTVVIDYVSKPEERTTGGSEAITSDKGLYFINPKGTETGKMPQIWTQGETEANSVWFPTVDAPNAKSTEEILITVQDKYATLSNGKMIASKKNADGTRTDHWKQDLPHAPYLFMMAVGEFKVVKDTYTRPDGTKMDVNYYVEPEFESSAKAIFGETPNMIKFFSQKLGVEYPWDKYNQIVVRDYVSGAMENTGAVIFGDFVYKTERELLDGNDQSTIAHELFHHWFGDLVTCESWSNLPLNESFANYSQYLWDEYRFGLDEADHNAQDEMDGYFESGQYKGYHNLIWFDYEDKEEMFDGHSYNKGGRILHMLRNYLGDEAFFKGLNLYLTSNKFKAAEFHNLRMAFEEVSGEDLNWFFNQWFLGKGHPIIFTTENIDKEAKTVTLSIQQKQNLDLTPIYRIPVNIGIWDDNGKRSERVIIDSLEQSFTFSYAGELKNVLFDDQQMLLGKFYDEKPNEQFVHQYYFGGRYKARLTALQRAVKVKNATTAKLQMDALSDAFWNIRSEAIKLYAKSKDEVSAEVMKKIKDIALNDPKSQVRAAALDFLKKLPADEATTLYKDMIAKDQSYLVVGSALASLAEINQEEALKIAREQEKANSKNMNTIIAEIYGQNGEAQDALFLENLLKGGSLKGYDELRVMFSYVVFMLRQDIEIQEKSHGMFTYLNEHANQYTKQYLSRAIQYCMQNFDEKINGLEMEIAELEAAKAFGQVDEKKKLKQRYEDLITNLLPLLPQEEEGGGY